MALRTISTRLTTKQATANRQLDSILDSHKEHVIKLVFILSDVNCTGFTTRSWYVHLFSDLTIPTSS